MTLGLVGAFILGILLLFGIGKLLLLPIALLWKLCVNGLVGGLILMAINFVGKHFGFKVPVNAFTALLVGFLGVPGVILVVVFSLLF